MMENKEVLDNLMGESTSKNTNSVNIPTGNDDELLITTSRVVGIRYKLYNIILVLVIFFFAYNYLLPQFDFYQIEKTSLSDIEIKLSNFENKKNKYGANMGLVDTIKKLETDSVNCVNTLEGCKDLPQDVKENFSVVRSYLLLSELRNNKMAVDEKKILENIDGFLLKKNPLNKNSSTVNGTLNKVVIGDKENFSDHLYFIPIELQIEFENKDGLMSFVENVEKKIPEDKDLRLLYKIDKINYDIVNYDQPQNTKIFMYLYFYDKS